MEKRGNGFRLDVGQRVRNLMNMKQGIIQDRWPVEIQSDWGTEEENLYEITADDGSHFAEYEENLETVESLESVILK